MTTPNWTSTHGLIHFWSNWCKLVFIQNNIACYHHGAGRQLIIFYKRLKSPCNYLIPTICYVEPTGAIYCVTSTWDVGKWNTWVQLRIAFNKLFTTAIRRLDFIAIKSEAFVLLFDVQIHLLFQLVLDIHFKLKLHCVIKGGC